MICYSVTGINSIIKDRFRRDDFFSDLLIAGEVTNCRYYPSGHIYFSLKDVSSLIPCVMFSGFRSGLSFKLEDGTSVTVRGSIEVYEQQGKYQLYAKMIEKEGQGELFRRFEEMKARLEAEGLFDSAHKKTLPRYALNIGIVTSESGAVIHDICNIARRRNPFVKLSLYPCSVQGPGAAATVIDGIRYFEKLGVDIIIFGRGGGSAEDLFEFNDEALARCIYDCKVPTVSAVGHESDFSISDFAADVRAATPSEAAELCVFSYCDFAGRIESARIKLDARMSGTLRLYNERLKRLSLSLEVAGPFGKLQEAVKRRELLSGRLRNSFERRLLETRNSEKVLAGRLAGLSPAAKLACGYSYTEGADGRNLKSVMSTKEGELLRTHLADGIVESVVSRVIADK